MNAKSEKSKVCVFSSAGVSHLLASCKALRRRFSDNRQSNLPDNDAKSTNSRSRRYSWGDRQPAESKIWRKKKHSQTTILNECSVENDSRRRRKEKKHQTQTLHFFCSYASSDGFSVFFVLFYSQSAQRLDQHDSLALVLLAQSFHLTQWLNEQRQNEKFSFSFRAFFIVCVSFRMFSWSKSNSQQSREQRQTHEIRLICNVVVCERCFLCNLLANRW